MCRRIMMAALVSWLILALSAACADTMLLPDELKTIGEGAFQGDASLDEVIIPEGVSEIPANAFADSGLKTVYIPKTVTAIGENAFKNTEDLLIIAPVNSAAAAYARENSIYQTVFFGNYPQGENGESMPVEWLILDWKGDRFLLLSRYGLDAKPYDDAGIVNAASENQAARDGRLEEERHEEPVPRDLSAPTATWETCSLRTWLNGEFFNRAFSQMEKSLVYRVPVDNSAKQGNPNWYETAAGSTNTQDAVYLLSYQEALLYFPPDPPYSGSGLLSNEYRTVQPTAYARSRGAWTVPPYDEDSEPFSNNGFWWLRSPGHSFSEAAYVDGYGLVDDWNSYGLDNVKGTVRPAIWVKRGAIAR